MVVITKKRSTNTPRRRRRPANAFCFINCILPSVNDRGDYEITEILDLYSYHCNTTYKKYICPYHKYVPRALVRKKKRTL